MSTSHENIGSSPTGNIILSISNRLLSSDSIVITTHLNPDGDALGSALGLWHWLQSNGRKATVILPNAAPSNLQWLPGWSDARIWHQDLQPVLAEADTIVVLDLNAVSRLGELGTAITESHAMVINIDHHTHPENFARLAWIDTEACSTCVMIAGMIDASGATNSMPEAAATCLYTGIMTDTGSFRFPRTTADVFRIAAKLMDHGADPVQSYEEVMNQGSVGRAQLLGKTLSQMAVLANGRLCVMTVQQQDLERYGCTLEDTEGFVQQTLTLQGVTMGILVIELPSEIKISFRSKGAAYVRELAAAYGGGGHVYAAGARLQGAAFTETLEIVKQQACAYLDTLSLGSSR